MQYDLSEISLFDLKSALDELSITGPRRHLLLELFLIQDQRDWERPCTEEYYCELLELADDEIRGLLSAMAQEDLIICALDMKTGYVSGIDLSSEFITVLKKNLVARHVAVREQHQQIRGPRPATVGVRRLVHELFEDTCELCGDRAVRGKDRRGKRMKVTRVKKDRDGTPDNVTLLCGECGHANRGHNLPADCRTLLMLQLSEERGDEFAPRTAAAPKPLKEVVLVASGTISVKTRNIEPDQSVVVPGEAIG
mgnify:CR=1 FL=1|jgi:hypothetical protein